MGIREITTEIRLTQWTQIMQERIASGLSVAAFCKERGIGRHSYFYWQKKLREAAVSRMVPTAEPSQALVPIGWAAVMEETAPVLESQTLTLRIGSAEIEVREGFDEALLASVIKTLSQSC